MKVDDYDFRRLRASFSSDGLGEQGSVEAHVFGHWSEWDPILVSWGLTSTGATPGTYSIPASIPELNHLEFLSISPLPDSFEVIGFGLSCGCEIYVCVYVFFTALGLLCPSPPSHSFPTVGLPHKFILVLLVRNEKLEIRNEQCSRVRR